MNSRERLIEVAGMTVNVRESGEGPPLLLINGLGGHTAMWAPVERKLTGMRLISYDSPGVGDSPIRFPRPSVPVLAAMLDELLDKLELSRVDVLGYSFGGAVAQQLAFQRAKRVRRLVLVATLPGIGSVLGQWKSIAHASNPLRYYSREYYRRTIGTLAGGQARWNEAFRRQHGSERLVKRPHPLSYYTQISALSSWSSLPWLHRITVPTLVVTGDDDPLVPPANSFLLASRIPRARLFVAHGEGHLLLFDDSGAAHDAIGEFLSADAVEESLTWQNGQKISDTTAAEVIGARGRGPVPWGPLHTVYRRRLSGLASSS